MGLPSAWRYPAGCSVPPAHPLADARRSKRLLRTRARRVRLGIRSLSAPRLLHAPEVGGRGRNEPCGRLRLRRISGSRHLTYRRGARETRPVPGEDGIQTSAEPVQRLDAREATEDPPHASECSSPLGHRTVSSVRAVVSVDPPHGLRDRLWRETHRRRVVDELPRP